MEPVLTLPAESTARTSEGPAAAREAGQAEVRGAGCPGAVGTTVEAGAVSEETLVMLMLSTGRGMVPIADFNVIV